MASQDISPLAGKPAPKELLIDLAVLIQKYHERPELEDPAKLVQFGTSGHRGTSLNGTFTDWHIAAVTQAICEYRQASGIKGPLYLGKDTHALSDPAQRTALEVLAANGTAVIMQESGGYTPTPVISHAVLTHNRNAEGTAAADGIVITPSHNPPSDGGFKYNPPNGGPADSNITAWVQNRANQLLKGGNVEVKRMSYERAIGSSSTSQQNLIMPYIKDLDSVIDMQAIRSAGVRLGVDPLGGASVDYWGPLASYWGISIEVVNPKIDPAFGFMCVDHDGKIRMDCSSPYAMASLVSLKDRFSIAFGNDADADRHGVVTPSGGLLNPNHYLSLAIWYLLRHRAAWSSSAAVGKTLVSSSMIDRVVNSQGRTLAEVPVGFKWFADGLCKGTFCFAGEESAGASFLRKDGSVWTSDKDGILLNLLAAEITAVEKKDLAEIYHGLTEKFGSPCYTRIDAPASAAQRGKLIKISPAAVRVSTLGRDPVKGCFTTAPYNNAPIGGVKITTENGWFAARPSGTEDIYKIYAESFLGHEHLNEIVSQAKAIVGGIIA